MLTQARLKELFNYDPETGIFTRLKEAGGQIAGTVPTCLDDWGYLRFRVDHKKYRAQRLAWLYVYGVWPTYFIDHINGNTLDNRIANLRDVTNQANSQNCKGATKISKTGVRGVHFHKPTQKYGAQINVSGKKIWLGTFESLDAASEAYTIARKQYHIGYVY